MIRRILPALVVVFLSGLIALPNGAGVSIEDIRRTLDPLFQIGEFGRKNFTKDLNADQAIKTFLDDDETTNNTKRKMLYGSSSALSKPLSPPALQHLVQNLRSSIFASFYTSGGQANKGPETSLHPCEFIIEWSVSECTSLGLKNTPQNPSTSL